MTKAVAVVGYLDRNVCYSFSSVIWVDSSKLWNDLGNTVGF